MFGSLDFISLNAGFAFENKDAPCYLFLPFISVLPRGNTRVSYVILSF